jgi:16S rRNA (cytosine967-C5)-methyltransferase
VSRAAGRDAAGKPPAAGTGARQLALDVLIRVEQEQAYSNLLLNRSLAQSGLDRREAALATELVYGTIQRRNTLDYYLDRLVAKGVDRLQPWVCNLLRMSLYQLLYLDRIPDHAVVSEAVGLAKRRGHPGIAGLVNGVLRNAVRRRGEWTVPADLPPARRIALEHSHPEWLVERWLRQFGEETTRRICAADNEPPKTSVRANRLRTTRDRLLAELQEAGFAARASEVSPHGIVLEQAGNMAHTAWYERGELSVQDESSMLVAGIVDPKPGMAVLDCCAAPGGKATHMAELMDDRGIVWANDLHPHKERLIREQASRLGLTCVRPCVGDAAELERRFPPGAFDRILLDAPCSGLGVIRRKPDLKWAKQPGDSAALARTQLRLLGAVAPLLKPDGVLVYSTCTLDPEENEGVVRAFLQAHPEFAPDPAVRALVPAAVLRESRTMDGSVQILPHVFHSDGFFICRLRRREG